MNKLVDVADIDNLERVLIKFAAGEYFFYSTKSINSYIRYQDVLALLERSPEASPPVEVEPVAMFSPLMKPKFVWMKGAEPKVCTHLYTSPPDTIDKSAYDGAREDLAIWKKRALEAEEKVRVYNQRIIDIGAIAMTPIKSADTESKLKIAVKAIKRASAHVRPTCNELYEFLEQALKDIGEINGI